MKNRALSIVPIHAIFLTAISTLFACYALSSKFTHEEILRYRERARAMFYHGYENYLNNAFPYDELRPLTCDGMDSWGSYSLTLIDALDTLAIMGNHSEFRRVATLLQNHLDFTEDINVSVFETNIRVVGGLLSAHLLSHRAGVELEPGWPCKGPLLTLADRVARRILPAFDTPTGMPYGTVNLAYGVPPRETPVTCTACVGTYIVEFGTLSRLTGDPIFEEAALKALNALWQCRSDIGLLGNHIDVLTKKWTAMDSGIGAGVDSLLEYLVKGGLLLGNTDLLDKFWEYEKLIKQLMKRDDWYMWVNMKKGQITMPVFQSLEAFWPGVQSLLGQTDEAIKTLHNYHQVWRQLGFTPEFYNIVTSKVIDKREGYPLRPELIESVMVLYQATKDPYLLEVGRDILTSIETSAWTPCGYASVKDVRNHKLDNRMESFFLSETTKYLYLLFDPDNFIHNTGGRGDIIQTPHGECVLNSGGYIFNTEAHPISTAALDCCQRGKELAVFENMMKKLGGKQERLDFVLDYINQAGQDQRELGGLPQGYNCSVKPFSARWSMMGEMMEP
ncbi:ER degradation-enhancing alpha-mannosidase-like protein 2 [Acanthaster planci]|uniref:alpha-1,2-Mannosidase n=1 Tax=Acanthaster planci TaxID=133434 RepID=A0A8B7XV11_ACAPL|nr:ER degradation-enhancing alpha-mannosidase-like protein 2 [Acanthaster planci]